MRVWVALVGAAAGVLIAGYAVFGARTDEEKILDQLERLERAIHVSGDTSNPVFLVARYEDEFEELFTPDVSYSIPELTSGDGGRSQLARLAARSAGYFRTLDVDFRGTEVNVTASGTAAQVRTSARVHAERGERVEADDRKVHFDLVDSGGEWLIASVRVFPKSEEPE